MLYIKRRYGGEDIILIFNNNLLEPPVARATCQFRAWLLFLSFQTHPTTPQQERMAHAAPPFLSLPLSLLLSLFILSCIAQSDPWAPVDQVLEAAVADGSFPGCVAIVGTKNVCYSSFSFILLAFPFFPILFYPENARNISWFFFFPKGVDFFLSIYFSPITLLSRALSFKLILQLLYSFKNN
jgi:hypothetical protein